MRTDPYRFGTPPRAKTIRRLAAQKAAGLPVTGKLVKTTAGYLHPTKGRREH